MDRFAEYVNATWMTVRRDDTGWYITHDVDWCIRRMAAEGWAVRRTGRTQIDPDDTIRTYVELVA